MSIYANILSNIKRSLTGLAKAPKGEQGVTSDWSYSRTPRQIIQDDVVTKKGSSEYELMRHDPDVKAALLIKTSGVLSKGWELTPGVDKEDAEYAVAEEQCTFVQAVFDIMPGSLDDKLEDLLYDALLWGVGISEKVWNLDKELQFVMLQALKGKEPRLYDIEQDDFGNTTKLLLTSKGGQVEVDPAKFVRMTYNAVHDEPWGTSDLRAAYLYWSFKRSLVRWWAVYLEKFASPTMKGTYPVGTSRDEQNKIKAALDSLQQETSFIIPDSTVVEMLETAGKTSSDFSTALDYYGKQIVKAILGQTLATGEGSKSGSYAQAKVHQDTLETYIRKLKRQVEETVNEQIIRDVIDYNFSERYYPNFHLQLDDTDITALTQSIYQMITAGEVIPGESWIRETLGWPERPEMPDVPTKPLDTKPPKRTTQQPTASDDSEDIDNSPSAGGQT